MQATFRNDSLNRLADAVGRSGRSLSREFATACNATARGMRTPIGKEIRTELAAPAKVVKETIGVRRKASPASLTSSVAVSKTKRIPLRDFGARQTKAGVSYRMLKSDGRKTLPSAFVVPNLGNHVFTRKQGAGRLPIKKRHGLSPHGVFVSREMDEPMLQEASTRLKKEIERRIQYNIFKANQLS